LGSENNDDSNDESGSEEGRNKNSKRRSKNDVDGRDHKCKYCDKTYLSYPALYTHLKQKHSKGPDGEMRTPPTSGRGRGRPRKNVSNSRNKVYSHFKELIQRAKSTFWHQKEREALLIHCHILSRSSKLFLLLLLRTTSPKINLTSLTKNTQYTSISVNFLTSQRPAFSSKKLLLHKPKRLPTAQLERNKN
jgi:hypothetical protein